MEACSAQRKCLVMFVFIITIAITTATSAYGKRNDPSGWWKHLNAVLIREKGLPHDPWNL